jgi:hypothetical protein
MGKEAGIAFGSTDGAHLISAFRAFVHDNGMPGVRLTKEGGEHIDVIFSVSAILELQKQLSQALQMAKSSSKKKQ